MIQACQEANELRAKLYWVSKKLSPVASPEQIEKARYSPDYQLALWNLKQHMLECRLCRARIEENARIPEKTPPVENS